jgi:hypothetical protein
MLLPLISTGHCIYDITLPDSKRSILREINLHTLQTLRKGFGGRIGILPRLPDGSFLINRSNRNLWGDFGGGVKAREFHLDALRRELQEEVPAWKDRLLQLLPTATIYSLEEFYPNDYALSKRTIRVMILCIIDVGEGLIEHFQPSEEVLELRRVTDLKPILDSDSINLGLQQLKKIYDSYQ